MVTGQFKAVQTVVEGKGKIAENAALQPEIKVFHQRIGQDGGDVIEDEGDIEGVGVADGAGHNNPLMIDSRCQNSSGMVFSRAGPKTEETVFLVLY